MNKNRFLIGYKEVCTLLNCGRNYAYEIIKGLRKELSSTKIPGTNRHYYIPKEGTIQLSYFCENFMIDKDEAVEILNSASGGKNA